MDLFDLKKSGDFQVAEGHGYPLVVLIQAKQDEFIARIDLVDFASLFNSLVRRLVRVFHDMRT